MSSTPTWTSRGRYAKRCRPRLQPLAGPAAGILRDRIELRAKQLLARPETQERWEDANRIAHTALMRVIDGDVESVELDVKALLERTEQEAGIGGRVAGALPDDAARITIIEADQLDGVQAAGKLLRALAIVLVVLSLALFGVALAVGPGWRRQAVRAYGVGFVVAGAAALAAGSLAGEAVVGALAKTAATEPVVRDVWDIYTTLLDEAAVATIFYGLVMIAGAWLAGPSGWATAVRRNLAPYLREPALAYGAFAVLVVIVVLWWSPTPAMRNPVTAVVLIALLALGFEGLRRRTAAEFPDADRAAAQQRMRQGLSRLGLEPARGTMRAATTRSWSAWSAWRSCTLTASSTTESSAPRRRASSPATSTRRRQALRRSRWTHPCPAYPTPERMSARGIAVKTREEPNMVFAADYPFLNIFWTMIIFFCWVVWIWMMISILSDVFRRRDISGWGKAGWTVFLIVLPFLGALIYLISQSEGMADRNLQQAQAQQAQMDDYVRSVATDGGGAAAQIEKAKSLLDSGAINQTEFDALKAKALAA